jgi:hypothetical protein
MRHLTLGLLMIMLLSQSLLGGVIAVYSNSFESTVGTKWSLRPLEVTPTGRRFLGRFLNQDATRLTLGTGSVYSDGLPGHNSVTLSFDLFIIHSWDGALYGDEWSLSVEGGPVLLDTSFSNPLNGTADNPQSYPGVYGHDLFPARTGATEVNALGYWNISPTRFGDSVYHLSFTFPHYSDELSLVFRANGVTGGPPSMTGLTDETWGLDNVQVAVTVPEPATLSLLALGGLAMLRRPKPI